MPSVSLPSRLWDLPNERLEIEIEMKDEVREAEKALCRNVSIEKLPGNKTRLVSRKACEVCGEPGTPYHTDDGKGTEVRCHECFLDDFWRRKLACKDDPKTARIDGSHYFLGKEKEPGRWNGFGGRWSTIRFNDGRIVKTCDLWTQGVIPEKWREQLPDNAKFTE